MKSSHVGVVQSIPFHHLDSHPMIPRFFLDYLLDYDVIDPPVERFRLNPQLDPTFLVGTDSSSFIQAFTQKKDCRFCFSVIQCKLNSQGIR
jgi:hypothetical protein